MKSLITYILMLVVFMGVSAHAGINHPNFSSETIFLECEGIKYIGKPRPTIYFYAIDNEKMIARRIDSDSFEWSKAYPMKKSPAQIKIKQGYIAWIIDRETLTTKHHGSVSSDCGISSLKRVDAIVAAVESKAKI